MTIPAQRTPQPERTRAMRTRLMQATIDCLIERGWAGTTTTLVSERAGVSRGAQLHHFPSKRELVVAAVQHLADQLNGELERTHYAATHGRGHSTRKTSTRKTLGLLADHFTSALFVASLELWVAARTDAELLQIVRPIERQWGREEHRLTVELLGVDDSHPPTRALVQGTLDMMRGFGLANTLSDDSRRRSRILTEWAELIDANARPAAVATASTGKTR